jgi:cell cycle checkpoint protein
MIGAGSFNPIAVTLMKKALTGLIDRHFKSKSTSSRSSSKAPSRDTIDMVVESAHGDIRSAIMALQFSCLPGKKSRGKKGGSESVAFMEAITRRESSLALFHLIGKVMYNKRKSLFLNVK